MSTLSLSRQNPWWLDPSSLNNDDNLLQYYSSKLRWDPRIVHTFDFETDAIYTLRGPRQVGKTTSLKLIIKDLIEKGVPPRNIFYWTCDLIDNPKTLVELVESYIQNSSLTEGRLYIFLDEISAVKDWQRGMKYLYDTGVLKNVSLLMTGSHSIDIKASAERLPGRRGITGDVLDKIMLPMKFSEYVELRSPPLRTLTMSMKLYRGERRRQILHELAGGDIPTEVKELGMYFTQLDSLFRDYLITGGLISPINDYVKDGVIDEYQYMRYMNVTMGDIAQWKKRQSYLVALLSRIEDVLTSRISWNSLKKGTDISHTNTVADYVDILESSFILTTLYGYDANTKKPRYESEKKIYFRDPFIFHSLRAWVRQLPPFEASIRYTESDKVPKLVESVLADHLLRLSFNLNPSNLFEPSRNLLYWSTKKHEVDFVLHTPKYNVPIELKYQNTINRSDYSPLFAFPENGVASKGVLATKDRLETHRGVAAIPVPILLTLI